MLEMRRNWWRQDKSFPYYSDSYYLIQEDTASGLCVSSALPVSETQSLEPALCLEPCMACVCKPNTTPTPYNARTTGCFLATCRYPPYVASRKTLAYHGERESQQHSIILPYNPLPHTASAYTLGSTPSSGCLIGASGPDIQGHANPSHGLRVFSWGCRPNMHPPSSLSMVQYPVTTSSTDKSMLRPQHHHGQRRSWRDTHGSWLLPLWTAFPFYSPGRFAVYNSISCKTLRRLSSSIAVLANLHAFE